MLTASEFEKHVLTKREVESREKGEKAKEYLLQNKSLFWPRLPHFAWWLITYSLFDHINHKIKHKPGISAFLGHIWLYNSKDHRELFCFICNFLNSCCWGQLGDGSWELAPDNTVVHDTIKYRSTSAISQLQFIFWNNKI